MGSLCGAWPFACSLSPSYLGLVHLNCVVCPLAPCLPNFGYTWLPSALCFSFVCPAPLARASTRQPSVAPRVPSPSFGFLCGWVFFFLGVWLFVCFFALVFSPCFLVFLLFVSFTMVSCFALAFPLYVLYYAVWWCAVLCCVVVHCAVLCCAMLCCGVVCHGVVSHSVMCTQAYADGVQGASCTSLQVVQGAQSHLPLLLPTS